MADIIYIHNDINKVAYRASEQRETKAPGYPRQVAWVG